MMEREIKFRSWIDKRQMLYSGDTYGAYTNFFEHCREANNGYGGCYLMQYIGLKDKTRTKEYPEGREIYEGDFVEVSMSFEGGVLPHAGEIIYDETFGAFGTKNEAGTTLLHNHCLHTMKIVGNIHENPELLTKERAHHESRR